MSRMETLERILAEINIEVDRRALAQLDKLSSLLLEYNLHTNLTAIRDPLDVEIKLFADSLVLLPLIQAEQLRDGREAMRLIDIGTGAGFPGLPLAIAHPGLEVTLVDATNKKVAFAQHAIDSLGLTNAIPIHARSEDLAHQDEYRERFDIVTARAVASLPALIELCLPFARIGGLALFPKGREVTNEIDSAQRALETIGADLFDVYHPEPTELENTTIINVRKIKPSPKAFPRSPGTPAKSPL